MIPSFRAVGRIIRIGAFLTAFVISRGLRRPSPDAPEYEIWRRDFFQGACRGILDRLNLVVEVDGSFPEAGGILVTNHLGYVDVLVLGAIGPTVFVSRADVEHWPVIGPLTRWCSTIYIDRAKRDQIPEVIEEMQSALGTGSQVVFFPEGTSGPGDAVMPFRASLFDVATGNGTPVRVGALSYRTVPGEQPARDSVCWWGDAGFAGHIFSLARLSRIDASVVFPDSVFHSTDRKDLAQRCQSAVASVFVPVTGSEGAN